MSVELRKIAEWIRQDRTPLSILLGGETPGATTKNGDCFFGQERYCALGKWLSGELHTRLRLPLLFFISLNVSDSCWCADAAAFGHANRIGGDRKAADDGEVKFWVSRAIAYAIARKYPAAVQLVMGLGSLLGERVDPT